MHKMKLTLASMFLIATLLGAAGSYAYGADVPYFNDFENSLDPLDEWSPNAHTDVAPYKDTFLGRYRHDDPTVCLTLDTSHMPVGTELSLGFDLYIVGTWDGNNTSFGPDEWTLSVQGGETLLHTTFSNTALNSQAYYGEYPGGSYPFHTGAAEIGTLGFEPGAPDYEAIYSFPNAYHQFTTLTAGDSITFCFSAPLGTDDGTEFWGLDNVSVTPEPASLFLLAAGALILSHRRL